MMTTFTGRSEQMQFHLEMLSDWHVGTGAGRPGSIDSLVRRDGDNLPFVSAKTLTGIWRDACERLAAGLDAGGVSPSRGWQGWVDVLFGSQPAQMSGAATGPPRPAALAVRPARFPADLRAYLIAHPVLCDMTTFVKPGVAIDPRSGGALEKSLRFEEMARGGVTLEGTCNLALECDDEQWMAALALLVVGAQLIERLGGNRRRGAGRCQLRLVGREVEPYLRWLEDHTQPPSIPERPVPLLAGPASLPDALPDERWLQVDLELVARTPVLAPASVTGNVVTTADFIPGTYLLPIVTRAFAAIGMDVRGAIGGGELRVLHATPEVGGHRGVPVPRTLAYEKLTGGLHRGGGVYNLLCESPPPDRQVKGHRDGFVGRAQSGELPAFARLATVSHTHNVIQDDDQRPTEEVGGVFSYEAIPAGTRLRSQLRVRASVAEALAQADPRWWTRLEGAQRLGRAKKDDYGLVDLVVLGEPRVIPQPTFPVDGELTVWLLSDLLVRDERLRPSASVEDVRRELEKRLDVELHTARDGSAVGRLDLIAHARRTESWHTGWGLPRPSLVGMGAGSCLAFRIKGALGIARLAAVSAQGLGERTAEGYGDVAFNEPLVTSAISGWRNAGAPQDSNGPSSRAPRPSGKREADYAEVLEREAWRDAVRRRALALSMDPSWRGKVLGVSADKPPSSQLGALRSMVAQLKSEADRPAFAQWLDYLNNTANRAEKWPPGAFDRLLSLTGRPEHVWVLLDLTPPVDDPAVRERCVRDLWAEAVRAVVDACVRAHQRDRESRGAHDTGASEGGF